MSFQANSRPLNRASKRQIVMRPTDCLVDLGPRQLAWLREKVPNFSTLKDQADASRAHSAEVAAAMREPVEGKAS